MGERPACPRVHVPARSAGIRRFAQIRADPVRAAATGHTADAAHAFPNCFPPGSHYLGPDHARGAGRDGVGRSPRAGCNRASRGRWVASACAGRNCRIRADPGSGAAGRNTTRRARLGSGGTGVCQSVVGRARRGAGSFAHLRSQAWRHAHQDRHAKPYRGSCAATDARGAVPCESGSVRRRQHEPPARRQDHQHSGQGRGLGGGSGRFAPHRLRPGCRLQRLPSQPRYRGCVGACGPGRPPSGVRPDQRAEGRKTGAVQGTAERSATPLSLRRCQARREGGGHRGGRRRGGERERAERCEGAHCAPGKERAGPAETGAGQEPDRNATAAAGPGGEIHAGGILGESRAAGATCQSSASSQGAGAGRQNSSSRQGRRPETGGPP